VAVQWSRAAGAGLWLGAVGGKPCGVGATAWWGPPVAAGRLVMVGMGRGSQRRGWLVGEAGCGADQR
jgi:hypothetical protein